MSAHPLPSVKSGDPVRKPRALAAGARVALVAPGGPLSPERIDASVQRCRSLGLEPVLYPAAAEQHRYLAGTDQRRLADLQAAFNDDTIDAVWALRGGYGTMRILRGLDLRRQLRRPLAFIGFSDNTAIHAAHAALNVVSFHGPHPGGDSPPETVSVFQQVLFHAVPAGLLPLRPQDPRPRTLRGGSIEAPLIGGNLALLAALCGTPACISTRGRILFLEDVAEPAYRVDRMLTQLRESGVLEGIAGLAAGRFSGNETEEAAGVDEVLLEFAQSLAVPAVLDLPIGHVEHNWTVPVGTHALLEADAGLLYLTEAAVRAD